MDNGNPWEIFYDGKENQAPELPSKHPMAQKVKTILSRVLGWMLILAVAFGLIFAFFVHPVDRLKASIFLSGGNYTISLMGRVSTDSSISRMSLGEIRVDRNLICVTDFRGDETYYLMYEGKTYRYTKNKDGEWERTESKNNLPVAGTSQGDVLLNRNSYERGELLRWKTKSDVKIDGYDVVYIQQSGIQYELEAHSANTTVTMSFGRFGTTKITPPWEQ